MDESNAQAREDGRSAVAGQDAESLLNEQNEQSADTAQDVAAVKKRLFVERTRIEQLGRIRQLVFGSLDGLLVPLGVVSAVAGGTHNTQAIIVAGVAEAFAGRSRWARASLSLDAPKLRCSRARSRRNARRSSATQSSRKPRCARCSKARG